VQVVAKTENISFPHFNQVDAPEGKIGDRLSRSALSPFRHCVKEDIGAIVDVLVIVQVGEKDIVRHYRPLQVIQGGKALQVGQHVTVEAFIFPAVAFQHLIRTRQRERQMVPIRWNHVPGVEACRFFKEREAVLNGHIENLTFISLADIDQAGEIGG
jgi:hypothetical protein